MEKSFTLTITGTERGEWQGRIKNEDGSETGFLSLMELLREINKDLEKKDA